MQQSCLLKLENGHRFKGRLIGAPLSASGELVFTTAMVGYSEALTDPSFFGQILVFSYPLIGNYGIPEQSRRELAKGFESDRIHASAVIVTKDCNNQFHWNSSYTLHEWLMSQNVPGIVALDTRELVQLIRDTPKVLAQVCPEQAKGERVLAPGLELGQQQFFDPAKHLVVKEVSCKKIETFGVGEICIGLIDCGVKQNIIRHLNALGCQVKLVPWDSDFESINCDGWLISNGPGDPQNTGDLIPRIRKLLAADRPILAICLGHQLLSLAAGAQTQRLPFGHRSHNQPVQLEGTRKGFITSQNHGYVVVKESLPKEWKLWFSNANDATVEGIRHESKPFRSIQFHPEAAGGPQDTSWILKEFIQTVIEAKSDAPA